MISRKKKDHDLKCHKMNKFSWGLLVFMAIYAVLLLAPYVFALLSSFKSVGDFTDHMFGLTKLTLENYKKVMTGFVYPVVMENGASGYYDFWGMCTNSFLYAIGCAFCGTMTPCIVGYCSAKFDFKIGKFLTSLVYVLMTLPLVGSTGASIQMTKVIGAYDTILGAYFLKCSFLGMNYLLYYGNFKGIPSDYMDAAYMDGAGNFRVFFSIMFPMVKGLFNLQMILGFVTHWSDYTTPMFYLPSKPVLALAMLNFSELSSTSVTMQMAGCILLSIPGFLLFTLFKDKFMGNVQLGGIKG